MNQYDIVFIKKCMNNSSDNLIFPSYHRIMGFYGFRSIGEYEVLTSVNLKPWHQ